MRISLADGTVLGAERLLSTVLRHDCTPVPVTLEFQVMLDDKTDSKLQENSIIMVGDQYLELTICKRSVQKTNTVKNNEIQSVGAFIAVLSGTENMMQPVRAAIYRKDTSIGQCLRASGTKIRVIEDVPLMKYFCPYGCIPSYEIAKKLGEEAAVMFCNEKGQIVVRRLSQIFKQKSKLMINGNAVNWQQNRMVTEQEIPNYLTLNSDGSTVEGELSSGAPAEFIPGLDARRLKNLSTALVTRGDVMRGYSPEIIAGDIIAVDDKDYFVVTAAHKSDTGAMGGSNGSASRLWIAEVVYA